MATYNVPLVTAAITVVAVTVPDDVTDPVQIAELAVRQNVAPTLCNHCAHADGQELMLGDDWDWSADPKTGEPIVTPHQ